MGGGGARKGLFARRGGRRATSGTPGPPCASEPGHARAPVSRSYLPLGEGTVEPLKRTPGHGSVSAAATELSFPAAAAGVGSTPQRGGAGTAYLATAAASGCRE